MPRDKKQKSAPKKNTKTSAQDIIALILADHKPLKAMIKIMKSEDGTLAKKKATFQKFAPTLIAHAKPEEQTWYVSMKNEHDMSVEGTEGDVEHGLADQLCDELKSTTDHDMFMAKVKVLAELVEHHLEEEEEKLLPAYRKESELEERKELGMKYLELQRKYKNPSKRNLRLVA
jgi:hemerythrin superfamily protein